jgi:hypothetical protein
MGRMLFNRNRSFELALCAGALTTLIGCGGTGAGGNVRSADTGTPVNTGLANLERSPGLALPSKEELMALSADEASIQEQIAESARQLEFYFTNLEIDGPSDLPTEPLATDEPAPRQADPTQQAIEAQQNRVTIAQPEQPNPGQGSEGDGGVRNSLLDLVGESDPSEDEPETDPADEPTKDEPAKQADPVVSTKVELVAGDVDAQMSPAERRDALAGELASILGEMVALGQDPGASAVALASLETLLPENTDALVDTGVLSEPELATLNAVRGLLSSMVDEGDLVGPNELAGELERIRVRLAEWSGITITNAALCTRVDGFGRFETFPSYRFRAGLEHEIIVYAELENFTQRESTGPDGLARYGIELSQRLELYHVADDLNTWNRSADTVRDESRNRLRDYYLTNRVWLPPNLGVGRYHLKIVMRDLLGERVAETIIPIEIVSQ